MPARTSRLNADKMKVQPDKTVIKALALGGLLGGGGECAVDVKDGKVVRIRPFHYDWKYDLKSLNPARPSKPCQSQCHRHSHWLIKRGPSLPTE